VFGLAIAHAGMGVTVAGITGMSSWATETVVSLQPGQSLHLSGYDVLMRSIDVVPGPNYEAERAIFDVTARGRPVTTLTTERRHYPVRDQFTTAAGIHTNIISNLYIALGERDSQGWPVRFYYHPLAPLIWLGAFTMAFGGLVSLFDRRLRVGVPQAARVKPLRPADGQPAPAE